MSDSTESNATDPATVTPARGKIHRYLCAICRSELRTPEVIHKDQVAVCNGCYASVQAAEKHRADRKARKLAAWDARQPK